MGRVNRDQELELRALVGYAWERRLRSHAAVLQVLRDTAPRPVEPEWIGPEPPARSAA